jgi:hemin uptake protein HemP
MDPERQSKTRTPDRLCVPAELAAAAETDPALAASFAEWWADRARTASDCPPRHDARSLTGPGNQAEIVLDGTRYVLRITRQRKLILTK